MSKPNKRYRIEDSTLVSAPPDLVMRKILSPKTWPQWQSEIIRTEGPELVAEGDRITGEATLLGFEVQGRSDATQVTEDVFVEDVIVGVRMVVTYRVRRSSGGTIVTRQLEADLPRGVAGGVLAVLLKKRLHHMQKRLLRDLSAQAEAEASG